ncbi:MAG: sulfatase-like hydrolase/transferase [Bacteroidaceae bacterium]|nr:sulfatase-like hydrolase/transferase [Bacteroidaceae bacterium]
MKKSNIAALAALAATVPTLAQQVKPNVVVIIADDLGWGDVSAYGNTTIQTPHIDRLAREGVCLTDGHATSSTSTPSRYGLITGLYPWKNKDAKILPGDAPLLVSPQQFTMPRMFQQAGYVTAAIGKWHLGMGVGKIDWNQHIAPGAREIGFDYSCIIAATVDRVPTVYIENGDVVGLDPQDPIYVDYDHPFPGEPTALTNPELVKVQWSHGHQNTVVNGIPRIGYMKGGERARWKDDTMAQYLLDRACHFIDSVGSSQPFFLYYGLHEPHVPRTPDTRFAGATELGPRGDVIVEADWCVGQLMQKLEDAGLLDNTLVVFSSDNGPVLDDGYVDGSRGTRSQHDPNGSLRGGKYSLFDAGTRVPFFVYWKGHTRHVESSVLVSQQDLLASFGKLIHQKVPDGLDSREMLSTFLGRRMKNRGGMVVEASGRLAYRWKKYALIPPYHGPKTNETGNELGVVDEWTLYDLHADPTQHTDISAKKPLLLRRLKRAFLKQVKGFYEPHHAQETLK